MLTIVCGPAGPERTHVVKAIREVVEVAKVSFTTVSFDSASNMLAAYETGKIKPDIVVLDIDSGGTPGISSAESLRSAGYAGVLILVSHTDNYAVPAFDVEAFNYALKGDSDDEARFLRIMLKAIAKVQKRKRTCLLLNGIDERRNAPLDTIMYFSVDQHSVIAHFNDGTSFEFMSALDKVEARLSPYLFLRTHRTYIVNMNYVATVIFKKAILLDGTEIPIGRSKWEHVKEVFQKTHGEPQGQGILLDEGA